MLDHRPHNLSAARTDTRAHTHTHTGTHALHTAPFCWGLRLRGKQHGAEQRQTRHPNSRTATDFVTRRWEKGNNKPQHQQQQQPKKKHYSPTKITSVAPLSLCVCVMCPRKCVLQRARPLYLSRFFSPLAVLEASLLPDTTYTASSLYYFSSLAVCCYCCCCFCCRDGSTGVDPSSGAVSVL